MDKRQVKQFLKQENLQPIRKLGQNFLINQRIIQKIVSNVQRQDPPFVEIGPGSGALTKHFADKKKDIILVERDKKIAAYWKEQAYSVLSADVLKLKWTMDLPKKFTLFGNLPYEIAASLILKSCLHQKQITSMVFMMQTEVAQRATARPLSKDYGFLSVISQTFWNISVLANALKTDFYPVPKVKGRVLEFQSKKEQQNLDAPLFLKFIKQCFSFKRKMLFKQIGTCSFEEAKKNLRDLELSETCRAQELSVQQFIELFLKIY